jgi:hypothetical protein
MPLLTRSALLALLVLLSGTIIPLGASDAKMPTMTGLIDKLDADNSKVILKTIDANPAKVKTMVVTIDKTSMITIDKAAAAYADLVVGDHVVVKYSQGVALSMAVTRAAPAAPAAPPAKP